MRTRAGFALADLLVKLGSPVFWPLFQFGRGLVVEGVADPHLEDIVSAGEAFVSWSER